MGSKLSLGNFQCPLIFSNLEQLSYSLFIRCKAGNLSNEVPHKVHSLACFPLTI
uniref:Uncharacterized protein n=1 Tax=Glycine max TaxID=3847 RepID=C6T2X7_SOYBN|nr:unknown [Glycine max]